MIGSAEICDEEVCAPSATTIQVSNSNTFCISAVREYRIQKVRGRVEKNMDELLHFVRRHRDARSSSS